MRYVAGRLIQMLLVCGTLAPFGAAHAQPPSGSPFGTRGATQPVQGVTPPSTAPGNQPGTMQDPLQGLCGAGVTMRVIQPLDLGSVRLPGGAAGFVTVTPDGAFTNSPMVLVRRTPSPGQIEVCGNPNQNVTITVGADVMAPPTVQGGQSIVNRIKDFSLRGEGISLRRMAADRWEGTLGSTGRARVRVGATALLNAHGKHGDIQTQVWIDVVPR